jgi:hypothetical protein
VASLCAAVVGGAQVSGGVQPHNQHALACTNTTEEAAVLEPSLYVGLRVSIHSLANSKGHKYEGRHGIIVANMQDLCANSWAVRIDPED